MFSSSCFLFFCSSSFLFFPGFEAPKGVPTVFDPSFTGVGQKPGLEIWRVEKLAVVKKGPSDKAYKGELHEGDSYIILSTKVVSVVVVV